MNRYTPDLTKLSILEKRIQTLTSNSWCVSPEQNKWTEDWKAET